MSRKPSPENFSFQYPELVLPEGFGGLGGSPKVVTNLAPESRFGATSLFITSLLPRSRAHGAQVWQAEWFAMLIWSSVGHDIAHPPRNSFLVKDQEPWLLAEPKRKHPRWISGMYNRQNNPMLIVLRPAAACTRAPTWLKFGKRKYYHKRE